MTIKKGGVRMLDLKAFNFALKATWFTKHLDDDNKGKWKKPFQSFAAKTVVAKGIRK